jgi:hypothetical protein
MKKKTFIALVTLSALAIAAPSMLFAQTLNPDSAVGTGYNYIASVKDGTDFTNAGVEPFDGTAGNFHFVGLINSDVRRSFFHFDLDTLSYSSGSAISGASLRLYLNGSFSGRDLDIYYNTLNAYSDMAGSSFGSTDWVTGTGLSIAASGSAAGWVELDVTSIVQAAYDNGTGNIVSFRLQRTDDLNFNSTGANDTAIIRTGINGFAEAPQLVVVPEPAQAGFLLALLSGGLALVARRRIR